MAYRDLDKRRAYRRRYYRERRQNDEEYRERQREAHRRWVAAHPEKMREAQHRHRQKEWANLTEEERGKRAIKMCAWRAQQQLEAIAHYGGVCYCCGESEPRFLALDHINGDGAQERKKMHGMRAGMLAKRLGYPDTFRVACHNCNHGSYLGGSLCWHQHIADGTASTLRWPPPHVQSREDGAAYERWRRWNIWREAIEHYGGHCYCCGEEDMAFLTLDHINGGGSRQQRESNGDRLSAWAKRNGYPDTLRVACYNCNHGAFLNGGVCPHQAGGQ